MPKRNVQLSELKISKAKAQDKPYRLSDGDGLFLEGT